MQRPVANILVLSDHAEFASSLEKTLRREGYLVRRASLSGFAATSLPPRWRRADLLIVDVAEKVEVCAQFLSEIWNSCPACTVLLVSAFDRDELEALLIGRSGVTVLEKPVKREALLERVRQLLTSRGKANLGEDVRLTDR